MQYRIIYPGNIYDVRPNTSSVVKVDYTFSLINGHVIEQRDDITLSLSSVVDGFAEGLRKIHVHGDVEIFVPSDLGYGEEGNGSEGANTFIPPYIDGTCCCPHH
mgnify:CR=1 FL=1